MSSLRKLHWMQQSCPSSLKAALIWSNHSMQPSQRPSTRNHPGIIFKIRVCLVLQGSSTLTLPNNVWCICMNLAVHIKAIALKWTTWSTNMNYVPNLKSFSTVIQQHHYQCPLWTVFPSSIQNLKDPSVQNIKVNTYDTRYPTLIFKHLSMIVKTKLWCKLQTRKNPSSNVSHTENFEDLYCNLSIIKVEKL